MKQERMINSPLDDKEIAEHIFYYRNKKRDDCIKYFREFVEDNIDFSFFVARYFDSLENKNLDIDQTMNQIIKCTNEFMLRSIKAIEAMYTEIANNIPDYKWTGETENND